MSKVLVYSCVTGRYDNVVNAILASTGVAEEDVTYVLYTDQLGAGTAPQSYQHRDAAITWELRPLIWSHLLCPRRTARWHKINSHLLPDRVDYTIWLDGSQRIRPIGLKAELLPCLEDRYALATFKHPLRSCVYQEAQACCVRNKDNHTLMQDQVAQYRPRKYPPYHGMVETACVIRKVSHDVTNFNQMWWQQIQEHSFRDQLSFNYVSWCLDFPYGHIPGHREDSLFFDFVPHRPK